jgi:peptidoglycan/LPS O-acetylase OafA/YrhL
MPDLDMLEPVPTLPQSLPVDSESSLQSKPAQTGPGQIQFVTMLRGVAALVVVWTHLVGVWLERRDVDWLPLTVVKDNITTPLGIVQDFGFLSVALFFLISGFIISHVAQREQRGVFMVKRVFRIYPPFIASICLILILFCLQPWLKITTFLMFDTSWQYILQCMVLVNYFVPYTYPFNHINPVAWTLVIEMLFYSLCWMALPWLKRHPMRFSLLGLGLCALGIALARSLGHHFFLLAVNASYLPVLFLGQLLYFRSVGRISALQLGSVSFLAYGIWMYGLRTLHPQFYPASNSYGVSLAIAYGVFVICLLLENQLQILPRWLKFYSNISYSLYLNHGVLGAVLLDVMAPKVGYSLALLIACGLVTAACYASWKWIEVPSQVWCRKLLNSRRTPLPG